MERIDQDPVLMERIRGRILSDTLLNLPQVMARHQEQTERMIDQSNQAILQVAETMDRVNTRSSLAENGIEIIETRITGLRDETAKRLDAVDRNIEALGIHIEAVETRIEGIQKQVEALEVRIEVMQKQIEALETRISAVETRIEAVETRIEAMQKQVEALEIRIDQMQQQMGRRFDVVDLKFDQMQHQIDERFDGMHHRMDRMESSMSYTKGRDMEDQILRYPELFACELNLEYIRQVPMKELIHMARGSGAGRKMTPDQKNFIRADLIIEAEDPEGSTCYVTVEASYTVDQRDTQRAIRNALLLTNFTGAPVIAVVTGNAVDENDQQARDDLDSGRTIWIDSKRSG